AVPDGTGIANQDQERGLERVLDIMGVGQDATTGRQHHPRVPLQQLGERHLRPLTPPFDEPFQEFRVGQSARGALHEERAGGAQLVERWPSSMSKWGFDRDLTQSRKLRVWASSSSL